MENHTIAHEFPEYVQKIVELKEKDVKFLHLYLNYEEINALILHYEENEQNHTTDEHLTDLRKKRVHLKDEIYEYLHHN